MSDAEKVEPSAHCPSPHEGESENDGSNVKNAERNQGEHEGLSLEKSFEPSWCLIDHPEIWMKPNLFIPKEGGEKEELKNVILRSERLNALMNKRTRNGITTLPDAETIVDYFCCAICNEIPYPWKGNPDIMMDEDTDQPEPFPETVYLCEQGHVVCRACAQSFPTCTFSKPDIDTTQNEEEEDTDSDTDQYYPGTFVDESMSMDSWGQSLLCFAPIDLSSHDFVLANLVEDSEFACRYFYNWCSFRGRGKALQDHEKKCEFKESPSCRNDKFSGQEVVKKCETPQTQNRENSDDDSAILNYDHSASASKANDLIGKILAEHLSYIDLNSVSSHVLRDHISGFDEQDADEELDAQDYQNGTFQPELVVHHEE